MRPNKTQLKFILILGVACLVAGLTILLLGGDQRYGGREFIGWERIDYGIPFLILGFVLTRYSMRKLSLSIGASSASTFVCPKCGTPYEGSGIGQFCPKCKIKLEPLRGFYKRHPEHSSESSEDDE